VGAGGAPSPHPPPPTAIPTPFSKELGGWGQAKQKASSQGPAFEPALPAMHKA